MVLGTLLGILLGPWGAFFLLLGLLLPILLPVIPAVTGVGHALANLHLWLAMKLHGRLAWVVDQHDRLVPKQMRYDGETGDEVIKLDGERKKFEDEDYAISEWMRVDMGLADAKHGVFFDPRHAAIGARELEAREDDETVVPASETISDTEAIGYWQKGVFEFPHGKFEVPRLSFVRQLIGGSERSVHPDIIREFYRKSQAPYKEDQSALRLLIPIAALLLPFLALWLVGDWMADGSTTGGSPGNSTGNDTDISLGWVLLWSLPALPAIWQRIKPFVVACTLALVAVGSLYATYAVAGPIFTIAALIGMTLGLLLFGLILGLGALSRIIGGGVASLLFRLGFLAYRRPVFVWQPDGYRLADWTRIEDDMKSGREPVWYRAFGTRIGWSFAPRESVWPEGISHAEMRILAGSDELSFDDLDEPAVMADGGSATVSDPHLPYGYVGSKEFRRAGGGYAGYIPDGPDDGTYYVHSGVALNRLCEAGTGKKSLRELLAAKEEYGGQDGQLAETYWLAVTAGMGLISFAAGLGVWIL